MLLPDDYVAGLAKAMKEVGGTFVLDCIASGTLWVDMKALGVDVVITAPQKGWTGPSCAGADRWLGGWWGGAVLLLLSRKGGCLSGA